MEDEQDGAQADRNATACRSRRLFATRLGRQRLVHQSRGVASYWAMCSAWL